MAKVIFSRLTPDGLSFLDDVKLGLLLCEIGWSGLEVIVHEKLFVSRERRSAKRSPMGRNRTTSRTATRKRCLLNRGEGPCFDGVSHGIRHSFLRSRPFVLFSPCVISSLVYPR